MDIVGGFALRDGAFAECLIGVDDHSRLCVSAKLMRRELSRSVRDGSEQALARFGLLGQLTGRMFDSSHHTQAELDARGGKGKSSQSRRPG